MARAALEERSIEHAPLHSALQHTPSAQKPLKQSVPTAHAWPCLALQTPFVSHVH